MIYYTAGLGYSDDGEGLNKWWTVQFWRRDEKAGRYLKGPWRRKQVLRAEKETLLHMPALLGVADMMGPEDRLHHLFCCSACSTINEFLISDSVVNVRCTGCDLLWPVEMVLRASTTWASRKEIERLSQGKMEELASVQGYTVGASYSWS